MFCTFIKSLYDS